MLVVSRRLKTPTRVGIIRKREKKLFANRGKSVLGRNGGLHALLAPSSSHLVLPRILHFTCQLAVDFSRRLLRSARNSVNAVLCSLPIPSIFICPLPSATKFLRVFQFSIASR